MKVVSHSLLALIVTLMTIPALSYAQEVELTCETAAARIEASPNLVKSSADYVLGAMIEIEEIQADRSITQEKRQAKIDQKLIYSLRAAQAAQARLVDFQKMSKKLSDCKVDEKK